MVRVAETWTPDPDDPLGEEKRRLVAYLLENQAVGRVCAPTRAVEPPRVRRVRSTVGDQSRLQQRDAPALAVMRELAGPYPRYGYQKIRICLARRGHPMRAERTARLWRQAGLHVPRRRVATRRPRPRGITYGSMTQPSES